MAKYSFIIPVYNVERYLDECINSILKQTYKDFEIKEIAWQYTMGQGETRIGKNRLERNYDNGNVKHSHELLILGEKKI